MNSTTKSIRRPDNHARPAEERFSGPFLLIHLSSFG